MSVKKNLRHIKCVLQPLAYKPYATVLRTTFIAPTRFFLKLSIVGSLLFLAVPSAFAASGLFGSVEFQAKSLEALPKWRGVLARIQSEQADYDACEANEMTCATAGMLSWRHFVKEKKKEQLSDVKLLQEINTFINQWPYKTDSENWHKPDYWATPSEFVEKSGDCEDYAIIKYVTLKQLGVQPKNLRVVVVHDTLRDIDHAVLAAYTKTGDAYILDSLINAVLPHKQLLQYTPYYSVNESTRWAHIMPTKPSVKK